MDLKETTLEQSVVYEGGFLKVRRDTVALPDGKPAYREFIVHPGAVAILALTDDGQLVLERQFRYPAGRVFLEIPAGKIDPDEPRETTARRELLEETGYSAGRWTYLGTAWPCIGYANEEISYYLAEDLVLNERQLDEGEFLEVVRVPLEEAFRLSLTGDICDSKSLVGLYWLRAYLDGGLKGATL